ncbi:hypothetical protein GGX14DRAFT_648114 [Mycena pura]|uniref:Uncharacterized protein n=1 Tax=Mycena pura TaxID=153505 RepID=A0AAD6YBG4_9AGAR|nr:hypothetical protein GGX14DRAFT_648114 [Mycena pura]
MSESAPAAIALPSDLVPYRAQRLDHEAKFAAFLEYVNKAELVGTTARDVSAFAIQLVTQVNFGPLVSKQYFASAALADGGGGDDAGHAFVEVTEAQILAWNLKKANAYKNFRSATENRFFEMNLYLRDTTTRHHWRADIARPAAEIDI